MSSVPNLKTAFSPALFGIMLGRLINAAPAGRSAAAPGTPSRPCPPQVLSNLPEIDRVDIRAMLKRWED